MKEGDEGGPCPGGFCCLEGSPKRYLILQVLVLPLQLLDLDGKVLLLRQQPGDLLPEIWEQRRERGSGKGGGGGGRGG